MANASDVYNDIINEDTQRINEKGLLPALALAAGMAFANPAQAKKVIDAPQAAVSTNVKNVDNKVKKVNDRIVEILAKTIYTEARGESYKGKLAVATIIWNRANNNTWRKLGLSGVCLQKKQFSGWNNGEPRIKINTYLEQKAWNDSLELAKSMVDNTFRPLAALKDSTYYYNPKKATPSWGKKLKNIKFVGNHKFGKL